MPSATREVVVPSEEPPAFHLRGVRQVRGGRAVLDDVSLDLPRGGFTALIGPSGSGKTSLLRLLNRLDDPVGGTLELFGRPITEYPVRALRRRVGFVFQAPIMFAGTVRENLEAARRLAPDPVVRGPSAQPSVREGAAGVEELLTLAGLDAGFAERAAADLSGGEKQRVALARTLMTRPEVLLLDEPTAALDPEVADRLLHTLMGLRETRGLTMVMVTHRLREARLAASDVVMLEGGRVVEAGAAAQVLGDAARERTRSFLRAGEEGGDRVP
jgi:ABC-type methionine transport system ATPase subunit